MFETSVVRARTVAGERRVGLLSASIAFHSLAAVAIIFAGLRSVTFPTNMPAQKDMWRPAFIPTVPPPQGNPNGGGPKPQQPKPAAQPPVRPQQQTAPNTVPDQVPTVPTPATTVSTDTGPITGSGDGPGLVPGPRGVPDGVPESVGELPATPSPATTLYRPDGLEVKEPVAIHRVQPLYPRVAIVSKRAGFVIVECVIDKSGEIRDAQVIQSSFAAFNQPALDAVRQWRFLPGTLRGKPVDTIFDLKVTFTIQ